MRRFSRTKTLLLALIAPLPVLSAGLSLTLGCGSEERAATGSALGSEQRAGSSTSAAAASTAAAAPAVNADPTANAADAPVREASQKSVPPADEPRPKAETAAAPTGMLELPPGIFLMGSRMGQGSSEERPMHEVIVASFYLDRTEVTTEAYIACMNAGVCKKPHEGHVFCNAALPEKRGNHPINCVDWGHADAYCGFVGKRLPTEREWEYAASGGAEERRFSWGNDDSDIDERACYNHRGSCPVASFPAGAFGLHDMSGSVWEWTSTWFGSYPEEAKTGSYRVYRGGSWSRRFPKWLKNTLRNRYQPEAWSASIGFRCAKSRTPLVCPADTEPKDDACVRVRGTPTCEPLFAWNGEACTLAGGATPKSSGSAVSAAHAGEPGGGSTGSSGDKRETDEPPPPKPTDPIAVERTPKHDPDCQTNWPKKPFAYKYSGATFHARNRPLEGAGCSRRDMGLTWTSACCPN